MEKRLAIFNRSQQRWWRKKKSNFDGVICGHIDSPEMGDINGTTDCNDGDWTESLPASGEDHDGRSRLLSWQEIIIAHDRLQSVSGVIKQSVTL